MARKSKVGIPYFSSDSDFFEDPKIKMLIAKYGSDGFTAYMKIITTGYKEHGYFLPADEDTLLILSGELKLPFDKLLDIIEFMCNKNLFNVIQKQKNNILTSPRMQNQYLLGTERREEISFESKYLLVDPLEEKRKTHKAKILVDGKCITETGEMYNNRDKMYNSGTQSESKVKVNRKYKESKEVGEPQETTFFNSHFEKIKSLYSQYTKISDPNEKTHLIPVAEFYNHISEHLNERDIDNAIQESFSKLDKSKGVKIEFLTSNIQAKITAKHEEKLNKLKQKELKQAEIDRKSTGNDNPYEEIGNKVDQLEDYKTFFEEHKGMFSNWEKEEIERLIANNSPFQLGAIILPKIDELNSNENELSESDVLEGKQ